MKKYECKIMNEAMKKEIDDLWDNGHAEALAAFGFECAYAYKEGYDKRMALILTGAGLSMVVAGYVIYKIHQKRVQNEQIQGFKEYVDNLKPGELKLKK